MNVKVSLGPTVQGNAASIQLPPPIASEGSLLVSWTNGVQAGLSPSP